MASMRISKSRSTDPSGVVNGTGSATRAGSPIRAWTVMMRPGTTSMATTIRSERFRMRPPSEEEGARTSVSRTDSIRVSRPSSIVNERRGARQTVVYRNQPGLAPRVHGNAIVASRRVTLFVQRHRAPESQFVHSLVRRAE